jgi:hypothetical protein
LQQNGREKFVKFPSENALAEAICAATAATRVCAAERGRRAEGWLRNSLEPDHEKSAASVLRRRRDAKVERGRERERVGIRSLTLAATRLS